MTTDTLSQFLGLPRGPALRRCVSSTYCIPVRNLPYIWGVNTKGLEGFAGMALAFARLYALARQVFGPAKRAGGCRAPPRHLAARECGPAGAHWFQPA